MLQAILLGLTAAWSHIEWGLGTPFLGRPLVLGWITGIILGDPTQGLIIGATIEIFFLGAMAIGSYIPPDAAVGGVLGTAFAIQSGLGAEAALTMAIPIAIIATSFQNVLWSVHSLTSKLADKAADQGNEKGIYAVMFLEGGLNILLKFLLVFFAWRFGSEAVVNLLGQIPDWFVEGMSVAGGILPAIGFAMLMGMTMKKKAAPFFFLGWVLAGYLGVPVLGAAVIGVVYILIKYDFRTGRLAGAEVGEEDLTDDDF